MVLGIPGTRKDYMTNDIKMHFCVFCMSTWCTNLTKISHKKSYQTCVLLCVYFLHMFQEVQILQNMTFICSNAN